MNSKNRRWFEWACDVAVWSAAFLATLFIGSLIYARQSLIAHDVHLDPHWAQEMNTTIVKHVFWRLLIFVAPITPLLAAALRYCLMGIKARGFFALSSAWRYSLALGASIAASIPFVGLHFLWAVAYTGMAVDVKNRKHPSSDIMLDITTNVILVFPFAVIACAIAASILLLYTRGKSWPAADTPAPTSTA